MCGFVDIELQVTGVRLVFYAGPWRVINRRLLKRLRENPSHYLTDDFSDLIFLRPHDTSSSIKSTTPTMALSIAAPGSPVDAVDADQPSWTTMTTSPSPASTESRARMLAPRAVPSRLIGCTNIIRAFA